MNKSFGEILIGTTFNPSGQDDVQYVKNEFAKLANLAKTNFEDKLNTAYSKEDDDINNNELNALYFIYDTAIANLINSQMSLVKLLTFKNQ